MVTHPTELPCLCGSGQYPRTVADGYGIFMFYACNACFERKRAHYRSDIFECYPIEEPLDPE